MHTHVYSCLGMSLLCFVTVFAIVVAGVRCSPHPSGIGHSADQQWGMKKCVIQDEENKHDFGCLLAETNITAFVKPDPDDYYVSYCSRVENMAIHRSAGGSDVIVNWGMTSECRKRKGDKRRGFAVILELSNTTHCFSKTLKVTTDRAVNIKREVISCEITVEVPNAEGLLFTTYVWPLLPSRKGRAKLGNRKKANLYLKKRISPDVVHLCTCEAIPDPVRPSTSAISLDICLSETWNSSSLTRKGDTRRYTPSSDGNCTRSFSDLEAGNYTVTTHYICKDGRIVRCGKDVTISSGTQSVGMDLDHYELNKIMIIIGLATGGLLACVVSMVYWMLKVRLSNAARKLEEKQVCIPEKNEVMVVYYSISEMQSKFVQFAELLKSASDLAVHFADDEASQKQRMKNKFDWLDECIRESSNFVFIATKDLLELLERKCKSVNNANHFVGNSDHEQEWRAGIVCYVIDLLRGKRLFCGQTKSRCFIISLGGENDHTNYAEKLAQLSIFQSKGTKVYDISKQTTAVLPEKFLRDLHGNKRDGFNRNVDCTMAERIYSRNGEQYGQYNLLPADGAELQVV